MEFKVKIKETFEKIITVSSKTEEEAIIGVRNHYEDKTIILKPQDRTEVDFSIKNDKMEVFDINTIPYPTLFLDKKVFLKDNKISIKRNHSAENTGITFLIEIEGLFFSTTIYRKEDVEKVSHITEKFHGVKIINGGK